MLTVVQVAYPLAPVGPDAVGGAEQILAQLDAAVTARGDRSIVVACAGSRVTGTLVSTGPLPATLDTAAVAAAQARTREAIARLLRGTRVDVVHLHGIDFDRYAPAGGVRTVATLHLPLDWYAPAALEPSGIALVCVSEAQRRRRPALAAAVIDNGVALPPWRPRRPRRFALAMGRLCPEKGLHLAIDAARAAGVPLLVAGRLFPYPAHAAYCERELAPRLGDGARFIGPIAGARKQRLVAAARCVVVPSLAAETSSLVALEALAAGTPVVALRNGALPELVDDGRTGWLADDVAGLAAGIERAPSIDRAACREAAERRFSAARMVERYVAMYHSLSRAQAA